MERGDIIKMVQEMRAELFKLARGDYGDTGKSFDRIWETLQSADQMLEHLKEDIVPGAERAVATASLRYASKYIEELGRFHGMLNLLKERHPILKTSYRPVGHSSYTTNDMFELARDFWMMVNLIDQENSDESNKQEQLPGSPSQGTGE